MFAKMKQKKIEDPSKARKEADKPSDGDKAHGPSPSEAAPSPPEIPSKPEPTTPSRAPPVAASFSAPSVSSTTEADGSVTASGVPPGGGSVTAGSNPPNMRVSSENKMATEDMNSVETAAPTNSEMDGGGGPQANTPSKDSEEPSSPGVGLLDSTRQLGSRMFGLLRNRLPMGEPVTPTGHAHQPHPPATPTSEEGEEPATPTSKPSREVELSSVAEEDHDILTLVQSLSHEELIIMATKERKTRVRYRKKCLQLKEALDTSTREKEKLQNTLQVTQDKSMTRITELKEAAQLDRKAKGQREEFFLEQLEEKNQKIEVLQTQVHLLKEQAFSTPPSGEAKPSPKGEEGAVGEEGELEALKDKVSKLEDLLGRYKEGLRRAKDKVSQLAGEKEKLNAELKAKQDQLVQAAGEKESTDSARAAHEDIERELEDTRSSLKHLQQDLAEREQKLDTANEESSRYKQEVAQLRVEKDNVVNLLSLEMEGLQKKLREAEGMVADLQGKLGETADEVKSLQTVKEQAEKKAQKLKTRLTSLSEELQESHSSFAKSSKEAGSLREELDGLKQQQVVGNSELQNTIHTLQEEVRMLQQELEDRESKVKASEENAANLERELDRTKAELRTKEDVLATTAISSESHRQAAVGQEEAITNLKDQLHQMSAHAERDRADRENLQNQLDALNAALESAKQDDVETKQEMEEGLRTKESELKELAAKYSTAVEQEGSMRTERDAALRGLEKARADWETQAAALKEKHQQEVSGLTHQYEEEKATFFQQSATNDAQSEREREEQVSALKIQHEAELTSVKAEHSQRLAEVTTALETKAEESRAHLESTLVAQHQEESTKLTEQLVRTQREREELAANATQLQNQLYSVLSENAGQNDMHTALQQQIESLRERLQSVEQDEASAKEECTSLKAEVATLSQQLAAVKREKEETVQTCAQLESKMAATLVEHEEKLRLLQDKHSNQLEQAKQEFEQVRADTLATLKCGHKEEVERLLAGHSEELINMRESEKAGREALVEDHKAQLASMQEESASQLTAEREQLQEAQALLKEKEGMVVSLSEEKLTAEEERKKALADLQQTREDHEAVVHHLKELQEAKDRGDEAARTALDKLKGALEQNQNDREQIAADYEERMSSVSQEKEGVITQLSAAKSESESLQAQVAELQRKMAASASELAAVQESHAAEMEHVRLQFEAKIEHLRESSKSSLEQREAEVLAHSEAERGEVVDQIRDKYQREHEQIRQQHAEVLEKLKKQAKARIESLKKTQEGELAQLEEASKQQSEKDQKEMSSLHAKLSACEDRLREVEDSLVGATKGQEAASARATALEEELAQCKEDHRTVIAEMEREKATDIEQVVESTKAEAAAELTKKIESERKSLTEQLVVKENEVARLTKEVLEAGKLLDVAAKEKDVVESSLLQSSEADRLKSREMEKTVQELQSQVATLKDSIGNKDSTIGNLQMEITAKEEALEKMATELRNTQGEVEASRKEIKKKAESRLASMKKQFTAQLEESERRMGEEREAWKSREQGLTDTIAELQDANRVVHARVKELEESSRQEKGALEASLQTAKDREKEMEESLGLRQVELESMKSVCEQQLSDISDREKQLSVLREEYSQLQGAQSALKERLKQQDAESVARVEEAHTSLQQALLERDSHQQAVEELREKLREAEETTKDVKTDWKERFNAAEEDWKRRMIEVTEKVEEQRQELLLQHQTQLKGLEDQLRAVEEKHSAVQKNVDDLQVSLAESQCQCSQLQEELASVKDGHLKEMEYFQQQVEDEAAGKYEGRLAQLSSQLHAIDVGKESEELQAQLDHLAQQHEEEMKHLTVELQSAQEEGEVLRGAEKERRQEIEALGQELVLLQDRVSSSEGMNRKMEQVIGDYKKLLRVADEERSKVEEEKKSTEDKAVSWMGQMEALKEENAGYEEKLHELNELVEELQEKLSKAYGVPGSPNQTPNRAVQSLPLDTPSKHLSMDAEPHGEEFQYFQNVLYRYMMGRGDKHMARALAALARFSPEQSANITKKHA